MKLWDKGISIDKKIEQFTVGNDREIDIHIVKYDVIASKAHAKMLQKIGIISVEELVDLLSGLKVLEDQIDNGTFVIDAQFEDVHSKIEFELTKSLGEVGKKIHTARSRNDQVLVALNLYYKDHLSVVKEKTQTLFNTLLDLAETHKDKVLPGYTHLQVAMPSSFGLWFSAYAELMIDDVYLLNAAALGGLSNTLARFAMDVCLYMSQNFGFISFPDELTTGSSIMPHKKNPDVFELIRGKCNKIQALQTEMILITNNLPSGYHRDFQLLKENTIAAFEEIKDILDIFNYSIQQIIVKDVDVHSDLYKYLFTVDNINTLVVEGQSFREAYQKIGGQVQDGSYVPDTSKKHTHVGSIHNLCLDKIRLKFPS